MEEEKKPHLSYKSNGLYKPKIMTMNEMQGNAKRAFVETKPLNTNRNIPVMNQPQFKMPNNFWKPKGQSTIPRYQTPSVSSNPPSNPPYQEPKPEQKPVEQEPYWSGVDWEEWAYQIYDNYPDMRRYLPEWFIQAVETNSH